MKQSDLRKILNLISLLSLDDREAIAQKLSQVGKDNKVFDMIEDRFKDQDCCPHCESVAFTKFGRANGLQRYRCKSCQKTFNSLTGTPLARLRLKEDWFAFLESLIESRSVRKAAAQVGVNKNTAFLWRHRFLSWISNDKAESLAGITEADETFFLYSEKGSKQIERPPRKRGGKASKRGLSNEQVCVLVARDRHGETADFIAGRGGISAKSLSDHLLPLLNEDSLLVSDRNKAYKAFSKASGIPYKAVNVSQKRRVDGAFHVQNVNAYHSRLKSWIRRFNGVATKYLDNYLGWRRTLDTRKDIDPETLLLSALGQYQHPTRT